MRRIYKYELYTGGIPRTLTGRVRRVLDIQMQYNTPVVWVELDDDCDVMEFIFVPFGTGWEIPEEEMWGLEYAATVQDAEGYVWHYYYRQRLKADY